MERIHPLSSVSSNVLSQLQHLDLTESIDMTNATLVGCGAFSDVFRYQRTTWKTAKKHMVAIKRLRLHMREDIKTLFEKEILVWSNIRHKNIVPLLGYAFDAGTSYPLLISEWMENGSAWQYVTSNPGCDTIGLINDIARGLLYLHDNNIIHSDLKTDNVLVSSTGVAMICDFGLSRTIASSLTFGPKQSEALKGTIRYLAPELLYTSNQQPTHTKATDVWAFGMIIYELVSRVRAYADKSEIQTALAVYYGELPSLQNFHQNSVDMYVTQGLWDICKLCWKHPPAQRVDMITVLYKLSLLSNPIRPGTPVVERSNSISVGSQTSGISQVSQDIPLFMVATDKRLSTLGSEPSIYSTPDTMSSSDSEFVNLMDRPGIGKDTCTYGVVKLALNPEVRFRRVRNIVQADERKFKTDVQCLRFSPNGKHLAIGVQYSVEVLDGKLPNTLWSGLQSQFVPFAGPKFRDVCFSPDGRHLATAGGDNQIRLWEIGDEKRKAKKRRKHEDVRAVAYSNDGRYLISGGRGLIVKDLDSEDEKICARNQKVSSLAVSRDGLLVAYSSGCVIRIYHLETLTMIESLMEHSLVMSLAFLPDGKSIICGCCNGILSRWDISVVSENVAQSKANYKTMPSVNDLGKHISQGYSLQGSYRVQLYKGLIGTISSVSVSTDGLWILGASWDRIVFYDRESGEEQFRLSILEGGVKSVAFHPEGGLFAIASGPYVFYWEYEIA